MGLVCAQGVLPSAGGQGVVGGPGWGPCGCFVGGKERKNVTERRRAVPKQRLN